MSNPWQQPFEDLREQQSVLSADAISNYASNQMVYDPKTQKMVPKPSANFKWDPNKNIIAPKDGKLGIMDKGDPKSWRQPSEQEKGEIPLSSTSAFEKSPAGQAFVKQRDASKGTTPAASTTTSRPSSSATASTAEKIKGGLDVYKSQVASGNVKGAEETGKSTWALANPELAKREAERQRTRGTSATTNPLMQDMKSKMSAPTTPSPEAPKTAFDKATPALATPKPTGAPNMSAAPTTNRTSTAFGEPTLLAKLSTPAKTPAKTKAVGEDSSNAIKGFLVREGYVREATAKRWWDDDGDGVGYEPGEVKGKFKKKKKK